MPYIGQGLTEGRRRVETFIATANQTTFNIIYDAGYVDVYQNGILLAEADYTATNGSQVVLDVGAALNDEITIIAHQLFSVTDTVSATQGGTFTGAITASGGVVGNVTGTVSNISNHLLDEDNMASNDATKVPSQQSVKAYVDTEVASLVDSSPGTLDTLNELAAALGDDANFSTTITNSIATKLPLAGGTMTGGLDVNSTARVLANNALYFMNTNNSASSYLKNTLGAGAADLRLGVLGDDKVTILSNGNVGIGTASPSTKLHVDGGGSHVELRVAQNSTYYTDIGINHIDVAGNDLRIMMGGSEKWRFKSGGDLYASGVQEVKSGDKSSVGYEAFFGANSLRFNRDGDSYIDTRGTNNNLKFRHNSSYDVAMTILGSNGNVGIGTAGPGTALHVYNSTANGVATFESGDA